TAVDMLTKEQICYTQEGAVWMYFVDRDTIEATLVYMEELLSGFDGLDLGMLKDKLALERVVHMVGESILDVGNMMIDGFIMRDPGGYEDIIDILIDEEVLPESDKQAYYDIIRLRKPLVKDY